MTNMPDDYEKRVTFINRAPEDKEWSAHVELLNEYTEFDRVLRTIVQYARSGSFYPADMHVDLIEQYIKTLLREADRNGERRGRIAELQRLWDMGLEHGIDNRIVELQADSVEKEE